MLFAMIQNWEIRKRARETLKGNWTVPVLVMLFLFLISAAASALLDDIYWIVLVVFLGAMCFGRVSVMLMLVRKKSPQISNMFDGFKILEKTVPLSLLMTLFVLLWTLLLIIPGIVAAFRYSMSFYLLYDNPKLSPKQAIAKSKEMMHGYKAKLFWLELSFIGWYLLGILTLCIAWFWIAAYQNTATAIFYEELKKEKGFQAKPAQKQKKKR